MMPPSGHMSRLQLSLDWPLCHSRGPWFNSQLSPMADLPIAFSSASAHQGKDLIYSERGSEFSCRIPSPLI